MLCACMQRNLFHVQTFVKQQQKYMYESIKHVGLYFKFI